MCQLLRKKLVRWSRQQKIQVIENIPGEAVVWPRLTSCQLRGHQRSSTIRFHSADVYHIHTSTGCIPTAGTYCPICICLELERPRLRAYPRPAYVTFFFCFCGWFALDLPTCGLRVIFLKSLFNFWRVLENSCKNMIVKLEKCKTSKDILENGLCINTYSYETFTIIPSFFFIIYILFITIEMTFHKLVTQ